MALFDHKAVISSHRIPAPPATAGGGDGARPGRRGRQRYRGAVLRLFPRVRGAPPSANGASSFHLWWRFSQTELLDEVAAVLEVVVPPSVPQLYFWALQAGFHDGRRTVGAGHTGLQWLPTGAPKAAVHWG